MYDVLTSIRFKRLHDMRMMSQNDVRSSIDRQTSKFALNINDFVRSFHTPMK